VRGGLPILEDGRVLEVANVIWCTGFDTGLSWIDLPIHGDLEPKHERGIVPDEPGLYFVGLNFLSSVASATVNGVSTDARNIAQAISERSYMLSTANTATTLATS